MKTRNITRLFALCLACLCMAAILDAARANPRKGKVYFKKHCRCCHDGQTEGAVMLEPIAKTMDQWTKVFAEDGEISTMLPRVKEKVGTDLTEQDQLDIQAYLVQHAADSDQPATCGQD